MYAKLQLSLLPDAILSGLDRVTLYFHSKRTLMEEGWRPHGGQVQGEASDKGLNQVGIWSHPNKERDAINCWDNSNSTSFPNFMFYRMALTTNWQVFVERDAILGPMQDARLCQPRCFSVFIQTPWNLISLYLLEMVTSNLNYIGSDVKWQEPWGRRVRRVSQKNSPLNIRVKQVKWWEEGISGRGKDKSKDTEAGRRLVQLELTTDSTVLVRKIIKTQVDIGTVFPPK